jgi:cobalt transporter subunit CbtA
VTKFRGLMSVAIVSGAIAGLVWFGVIYFAVVPLIKAAETYETAAHEQMHGHDEGWQPAEGLQRNSFTALATVLTSIGFAAILFGFVSLTGHRLDKKRGALWGLAAFACFALSPALGLPPQPPGVAAAELGDRQIWWACTALSTAVGLYLMVRGSRSWPLRFAGIGCLLAPHVIGPPHASGENLVPAALVRQFTTASLLASLLFWLILGVIGGFVSHRFDLSSR